MGRRLSVAVLAGAAVFAAGLIGCRVHVDKDSSGQEKNVQVETPFGGVHVNTDQTTAADLGLPAYPNSQVVRDQDNDKSANVHLGFGQWEMRVKVVNYSAPDSEDKVVAFYKKALGHFGDVIACQNKQPVGSPSQTSEGLTCSDSGSANVKVDGNDFGNHGEQKGLELKAGSKRHQHIVAFKSSSPGETRFALIEVILPAGFDGSSKSD